MNWRAYVKRPLRLTALFSLASVISLAGSWTGALVDSDCYDHLQANTSHDAGHTGTNNKKAIRYCAANGKTKSYAIIQSDGSRFNLDCTGQEKAIEQALKASNKAPHLVHITGDMNGNAIKVAAISKAK